MLSLSVPLNIILFLSTVPGIALGLGASKLFGNVISGLAMQADQHLNVGNFCKVGDTLGYVKRVGLRSIDIQTYEACVTIPNSYAEGTNVINYSTISDGLIKQSINLRIELVKVFLPGQKKELIRLLLEFLNKDETYSNPIVSIDNDGDKTILIIYALIINKEWREFVDIRNELNVKADEIIMQVYLSRFIVGVSYDTKPAQLDEIPIIIEDIVDQIDDLQFDGCNLGQINEFSYDFVVCIVGKLKTYGNFLKKYDKLNKLLISKFEERGISIPFPTTTFDQKKI
tara:strand:- start:17 stop:871 length:855 start_codon:yes stop_codon:yes gene_type:complete